MEAALLPGVSFGPFVLGASLNTAMANMRSLGLGTSTNPADLIVPDKTRPFSTDIVLSSLVFGVCLRVDSKLQTLRLIEVHSLQSPSSSVTYQGLEIASTRTPPTLRLIFKRMGPTYPGCMNERNEFILAYPGIAFVFPIAEGMLKKDSKSSSVSMDLLLAIPSEKTPIASRIYIFNSLTSLDHISPDFIQSARPVLLKSTACALIHAIPGKGLTFPESGVSISLGTHAQHILACLGNPADVFNKTGPAATSSEEYQIWNYFSLGLDIVFDTL
ncbi:hypothetical protein HK100_003362, partial [Physocladia obscura]